VTGRFVLGLALIAGLSSVTAAGVSATEVREAALATYYDGMTAEIAQREIGPGGIAELLRLLDDPAFPRHDNVVSFLAYLGGSESTHALIRALDRPRPAGDSPEEVRSILLVPHALGRIAGRGEPEALRELLALTANHAPFHGPGASVAILREALSGLALSGAAAARDRLAAIADGRVVPDPRHPELAARAREALADLAPARRPPGSVPGANEVDATDPASQVHAHGLTFLNHANVTSPMTTARLDAVLTEATARVGTADDAADVACCAVLSRSGNGGSFGTVGDGLDAISTSSAMSAVLNQSGGRIKVVNVINWCGGNGTNIIGCSYTPGQGMVLVRLSGLGSEAVLWAHEYGHNLGLNHSSTPTAIMFGTDNGQNDTLAAGECATFHNPSPQAGALISVVGFCGAGSADIDGSGRVDGYDLALMGRAFGAVAGNPRYDAACDLDHDGQVDGTDLAILAASFGS